MAILGRTDHGLTGELLNQFLHCVMPQRRKTKRGRKGEKGAGAP
jgi:hypothetical protein